MKAAVVHGFGWSPRFEEFPEPILGEGEVTVEVRAVGLHPVVRALAAGSHYGSTDELPLVPGVDGVGTLENGTRVYFGGARPPYGTMAERAVVPRAMCFPLPDGLDDGLAAAVMNPGMAAWLALTWRGRLAPGETVLILGATGVSGQIAIQIARRLGAGKIIAAGRNERVLSALGADATIRLDRSDRGVSEDVAREAGENGIHVIVDYLWGRPTEAVILGITRRGLGHAAPRVRLVEVGESAGPTITLPAGVLRSSGLEILGSGAGTIPIQRMFEVLPEFVAHVVEGEFRIDVERVPLSEVEEAWSRDRRGPRPVIIP